MSEPTQTGTPYGGFLGIERGTDGIAVLTIREAHLSDPVREIVHGGVIAAFMEAVAQLELAHGVALDFTSEFLRPARRVPLFASAEVLRTGRRFAAVRVDAWQHDRAALVATGVGTFSLKIEPGLPMDP